VIFLGAGSNAKSIEIQFVALYKRKMMAKIRVIRGLSFQDL